MQRINTSTSRVTRRRRDHASRALAAVPNDGRVDAQIPQSIWQPMIHRFVRHVNLGTITISTVAITTGGFSFQLSDLPDYADFQTLFDLYRIDFVQVTMYPSATEVLPTISSPFVPVRIITAIDLNSSNSFASFNQARDFETARVHLMTKTSTRSIKPRYISVLENDASASVFGGSGVGWLNTSVPNVPHYGYRYAIEQASSTYTLTVNCEAKFYLSMRAVK